MSFVTRRLPDRATAVTATKILVGSAGALMSVLAGYDACPPEVFTTLCGGYGPYFMPIQLMNLSVALLSVALLLSAFRDILMGLARVALLEHGVEAIADPVERDLATVWAEIVNNYGYVYPLIGHGYGAGGAPPDPSAHTDG